MSVTTDPNDPSLVKENDETSRDMAEKYLVLSREELDKGFVRKYRDGYFHNTCHALTRMAPEIAGTFARNPQFYTGTYCSTCRMHRPVFEFTWPDGSEVGS